MKITHIALPSVQEQREITRRVMRIFASADKIEEIVECAMGEIQRLTPSILAKAFRGELVQQNPNDQPASELLARIKGSTGTEKKVKEEKQSRKERTFAGRA